jgi:hypothetical protein
MGAVKYVIAITLLVGLALAGGGGWLIYQRETGTRGEAKVSDCQDFGASSSSKTYCTGSWVVGGSLLAGGHVVVGPVNGAEDSDIGKTISVTLRGGEAYTRSLTIALILISMGLVIVAGGGGLWKVMRTP